MSFFRFLNSLGNPVELSRPDKVCQTQQFFQYAIVSDSVIDPTHHPCLHSLPTIFFKAMQGVSAMVDAYLGEFIEDSYDSMQDIIRVLGMEHI